MNNCTWTFYFHGKKHKMLKFKYMQQSWFEAFWGFLPCLLHSIPWESESHTAQQIHQTIYHHSDLLAHTAVVLLQLFIRDLELNAFRFVKENIYRVFNNIYIYMLFFFFFFKQFETGCEEICISLKKKKKKILQQAYICNLLKQNLEALSLKSTVM